MKKHDNNFLIFVINEVYGSGSIRYRSVLSDLQPVLRSRSRPEPPFLAGAGAGAEKITQFRLRLHHKGRRMKSKLRSRLKEDVLNALLFLKSNMYL